MESEFNMSEEVKKTTAAPAARAAHNEEAPVNTGMPVRRNSENRTFQRRTNPDGTPMRRDRNDRNSPRTGGYRGARKPGEAGAPGSTPGATGDAARGGDRRGGGQGGNSRFPGRGGRAPRRSRDDEMGEFESTVINVRRVTRVVKGGKRMRFSALVVVGDKKGKVGYGLSKGLDYQDAVAKATKQAKKNIITVTLDDAHSIAFSTMTKHKSCVVMLKPATAGTGLIAGGYLRPVLTLTGVQNIYSKIIRSNNKVAGVQAAFKALEQYSK
jgi:small subunit ribosomal protein S5